MNSDRGAKPSNFRSNAFSSAAGIRLIDPSNDLLCSDKQLEFSGSETGLQGSLERGNIREDGFFYRCHPGTHVQITARVLQSNACEFLVKRPHVVIQQQNRPDHIVIHSGIECALR